MQFNESNLRDRLTSRNRVPNSHKLAGDFISRLGGGKPDDEDLASKLEYEVLKNQLTRDPLSDRLKESQIGAYDALTDKRNRQPSFFGFGEEEDDSDIQSDVPTVDVRDAIPQTSNTQEPSISTEQLESYYQAALQDPNIDKEEARRVYDLEKSRLSPKQNNSSGLVGDMAEFDIDDSDRQYLIDSGFTPEDVDLALESARRRKAAK